MKNQGMAPAARRLGWALYDLAFPRRCPYCGGVIGYLPQCPACAPRLQELYRRPFRLSYAGRGLPEPEGAASLFQYRGLARKAILQMKHDGKPWYGRELAFELARQLYGCTFGVRHGIITLSLQGQPPPQQDVVVSVPSSRAGRGYDSTARMAAALAAALGLPFLPGALRKVRATCPQAGLAKEERLTNVAGSMRTSLPDRLEGRRVLLVDDVITTGATCGEATRALLQAGALSVFWVSAATAGVQQHDR